MRRSPSSGFRIEVHNSVLLGQGFSPHTTDICVGVILHLGGLFLVSGILAAVFLDSSIFIFIKYPQVGRGMTKIAHG